MLETTRSYAREQLAASCEEESVLAAHEQWVVDLVRAAHEGLRGPDEPAWVERLDLSWADVRAVLLRSLERDDLTVAVELVVHLAFEAFWRRPEAFGWARRTAEQLGDRPHPDRHDLLGAAGIAAWASGDPVQALALGREALAIEPDPAHSFDLLAWLAAGPHGSGWCGELEDAITLAERALQAVQDDVPARAFWSATLQILRVLAARGGDDPALPAAAIADADATGNPTLRSYARFACATGLASPQDGTLALPHLEVALDLARSVRNTWLLDEIAGALGTIGPAEEASARLGPALELTAQRLRLGYVMHAWSGLATVAIVLLQLGRVEDAFVAVAAARGSPAGPAFERVTWQPLRAFMCAYLEADRVDELERRAASMDLPALLELARSG
jgi:tetratricopeptide (TPR) repeat protein